MTPLHSHLADLFLTLLAAAATGWLLGRATGLFAAVALVLALWLAAHLLNLAKLRRWLTSPKLRLIPQGHGVWQDVFDTLLLQAKSRKKRKQQIAAALQRFNRAAEAMPNGVIILDAEQRIEWMNHLAAEHLSLTGNERGQPLHQLVRLPGFQPFLQLPATETHALKLTLNHDRQRARTLLLVKTSFDQDAQLLISQDISAAEQLHATRTAFIANLSHELRTPLTVINGFLETLADLPELPVEQQQEFIALMRQEGSRMQELLADLLTLSRLESRTDSTDHHQPFDLSALCRQIAEAGQALSQGRHRFAVDIEDGIQLHGIPQDLYSALSNIAFNAVRYTPAGGSIRLLLQRQMQAGGAVACFAVSDSGPGIAAEHLPHLTERFYRADPARSRHSGGTGLGLAITKHALAEHRAVLEIDSTLGQGSTFSTCLPLEPASPARNGQS